MSKKLGFLFPGQGSQAVGMGRDAAEHDEKARVLLDAANATLGIDLRALMFDGPEEELRKTEITQPALFAASAATLSLLSDAGVKPFAVAGHSLGEYTALYCAGVFGFEDGLRLVRARGLAFAEAGSHRPGAMAAIIGLDAEKVVAACEAASSEGGIVVVANFNEPMQMVISGDADAVPRACAACTEAGAKRALPLPVSGAFHSPLVAPAAEAMEKALGGVELQTPQCHVVNNVEAKTETDPAAIRDALIRQITSSVRWVDCIRRMRELGVEEFVEVGSGKVLAGLCKRIDRGIVCHTTESQSAIEATLAAVKS